jgi:hypothetical protein
MSLSRLIAVVGVLAVACAGAAGEGGGTVEPAAAGAVAARGQGLLRGVLPGDGAPDLEGVTWVQSGTTNPSPVHVVHLLNTQHEASTMMLGAWAALRQQQPTAVRIVLVSYETTPELTAFIAQHPSLAGVWIGRLPAPRLQQLSGLANPIGMTWVTRDDVVTWRGLARDLVRPLRETLAGRAQPQRARHILQLADDLRRAIQDDEVATALGVARRILDLDPLDQTAVSFLLDYAISSRDGLLYEQTLAGLPVEGMTAREAAALGRWVLTQPDPEHRCLPQSVRLIRHALTADPNLPTAVYASGRLALECGQLDLAEAAFARAQALLGAADPTTGRRALGWVHERRAMGAELAGWMATDGITRSATMTVAGGSFSATAAGFLDVAPEANR